MEGALFLFSAVACFLGGGFGDGLAENLLVVTLNYVAYVAGATVRQFDGVAVDDAVKGASRGKVFFDELKKVMAEIGFDCLVERGVVPDDVSLSFPLALFAVVVGFGWLGFIVQLVVETAFVEGLLVVVFSPVEFCFGRRDSGEPFIDGDGDLL